MIRTLEAESSSYYKGLQQAKADLENEFRRKIRGFSQEVEQRAETAERLELRRLI